MLPLFLGSKEGRSESSFWAVLTTILAVLAVARTALPTEWLRFARRLGARLFAYLDPYSTYTFHEFAGSSPDQNYERVKIYLSGRGVQGARRVLVSQPKNASSPVYALADNEAFIDDFEGVNFHWVHFVNQRSGTIVAVDSSVVEETRSFQLKVLARHQHIVQKYVSHIIKRAAELEQLNRELLIYNYSAMGGWRGGKGRLWESQPFKHPATFDTLALDHQLKAQVVNRLEAFRRNAAFYSRTGRAHKMGFFLFGPPGCGKTSFVAAVANHLHYDVYDLDLSSVGSNSSLRGLLTQIGDNAVVVVEDIDTVELPDRRSAATAPAEGRMGKDRRGDDEVRSTLTLGGVLNFADGLRSSSGSERIFIFTTNHPERLDPALIRPGRMDMHIQLTYCGMDGIRDLCRTYLGVTEHPGLAEIERLLSSTDGKLTPAQAAGVLEGHADDPDAGVQALIQRLSQPREVPSSCAAHADVDSDANRSDAEKKARGQKAADTRAERYGEEVHQQGGQNLLPSAATQ